MEHRSFFINETQRHEFCDAARTLLNVAQDAQVDSLMAGTFNVTVHDRGGRSDSYFMRGLNQIGPFRGANPPGRDLLANFID